MPLGSRARQTEAGPRFPPEIIREGTDGEAQGMDFASVFNNIMDMVRDNILLTIGYGILGLVAAAALVILAKEGFGLAFTQDTPERRQKMKNCVYVLGVCLVLAFLPAIINGVIALAGTATNLGQSFLTI